MNRILCKWSPIGQGWMAELFSEIGGMYLVDVLIVYWVEEEQLLQ